MAARTFIRTNSRSHCMTSSPLLRVAGAALGIATWLAGSVPVLAVQLQNGAVDSPSPATRPTQQSPRLTPPAQISPPSDKQTAAPDKAEAAQNRTVQPPAVPPGNGSQSLKNAASGNDNRNAANDSAANDSAAKDGKADNRTTPSTQTLPPTARRPAPRRSSTPRLTSFSFRRRRLARTPDMLGDSFLPPVQFTLQPLNPTNEVTGQLQLSVAGGAARAKLAEHNKALPVDRFYASYNHFHNAAQRGSFAFGPGPAIGGSRSVDRFTLGLERTLQGGDSSIELRLPLTSYPDLSGSFPGFGPSAIFSTDTGTLGNLSIVGKRLLVSAEDLTISAGLGVEVPVGEDAWAQSGNFVFHVENQGVYLQPFLAATLDNGSTFVHSFLQIDIEANASPLRVQINGLGSFGPPSSGGSGAGGAPFETIGRLDQPTLIHWDTSIGRWLARSDDDRGLTGIAAIAEFHLTAGASGSEHISGTLPSDSGPIDFLSQSGRQLPATYFTTGLHLEFAKDTTLRIAGVFPLASAERRLFDSEVLVQFGRRY